jgi:NADPH2:quinone reductase
VPLDDEFGSGLDLIVDGLTHALQLAIERDRAGWTAFHGANVKTFSGDNGGGMRAAQLTRLDGPDGVEVGEIDEPSGDGVVVDVHAAGAAFPDALLTRGLYQYRPDPPFVLGAEIAGVVRSAPSDAHVQTGDRVVGLTMLTGGMAEVAVLQPDRVFKLPDNVTFSEGAGLLFNDLTVYFALTVRGRLQSGETVLVHGAAGGIGTSALRLAPVLGASRVIAVVSTQDKAEIAKAAGATDVVLAEGFKDAVKELTDGRGVDVVVDPVGGDRFTDSLRSLAPAGRLLVIGFTGGEIPTVKVNRLLLNNIDVIGVGWGAWAGTHPDALAEQWAALEQLLASGKLPPPEPVVYPLDEAAAAIASLENRTAKGKVVIRIRD